MSTRPHWHLALFALLAFLLAYSWMSAEVTAPNERSRIYLTMSLLESGTLAVDDQVETFGLPFDIAERDGHYYTDKAPGSSIAALPAMFVYALVGGDTDSIEKLTIVARLGVMLPITLASLALFWLILSKLGLQRRLAAAMVALLALSTNLFHYGTAFYGHGIALFCTLVAAVCIFKNLEAPDGESTLHWPFLAGFAGASAFAMEYQGVIVFAGLALGFLSVRRHRTWPALLAFGAGAAIPVVAVFAYHWAAFGHPLTTSYDFLIHDGPVEVHDQGLWGISTPSWEAMYGLMFSPSRGLLMCAPLVLFGLFGLIALWRRARWLAIYAAVTSAGYLYMAASAQDVWFGGWSFGPRLLIPMFGLAAIAGAVAYDELRRRRPTVASALLGVFVAAIGYVVFVCVMFPELPPTIAAPLPGVAVPLAGLGSPSPNLGMLIGLEGNASLIPLVVGVVVVAAFVLWACRPEAEHNRWRRWLPAASAVLMFAIVAMGYPEQVSEDRLDDFVERRADLRMSPR